MRKETLSALMDGELIDNEVINSLSRDRELQQTWNSYHLIRDMLRSETNQAMHINIADKVLAAIELEHMAPVALIPESQEKPENWHKMSFWSKVKPLFSQMGQVGIAAGVSLAVIFGVQHYNYSGDPQSGLTENSEFNIFSIGSLTSPVSYGTKANNEQSELQDRRRHLMILQNYELQRRIYAQSLASDNVDSSDANNKANKDNNTGINKKP